MKVGLKLNEQFTVSKHNIVQVTTFENEFHLALTNSEYFGVEIQDVSSDETKDQEQPEPTA
ncbi:hypothetical protein LQJ93_004609 [Vibrio parahaemolyticus]|nr:hypothetical protein [Vibrio parahaemolyticus]